MKIPIYRTRKIAKSGALPRDVAVEIGRALKCFFLENGFARDPSNLALREPDIDFEIFSTDLTEDGFDVARQGIDRYFARFDRNNYADPYDFRVLLKCIRNK